MGERATDDEKGSQVGPFDFVFLNQSCSTELFGLCARVADELGPTLLYTGTELHKPNTARLTVVQAPAYDNTSYRSRLKTWLSYSAEALKLGSRLGGTPVVVVTSNPPFGPFLGYFLRKTRRFRYVIRVLDVYPDAILQSGLARGALRVVPPLWEISNRVAFQNADRVVTLGECMAERVKRFMRPGQELSIIPDWVDTDRIISRPKAENWFARQHGQIDRLTVLYSGNLGVTHDIEGVFSAMTALEQDARIQFLFIGGGARRGELLERARGRPNCQVLPNQAEDVLPYSLGTGDVALVLLGDSGRGVSMPSKTYFMMASRAAILGISSGDNDLKRTIERHGAGMNLEPGDAAGIVQALQRFASDAPFLERCRENARRAAEANYSRKVCGDQLVELLADVRTRARSLD
jgi:colanic acid biosynthesis glycosyl transferase WcaI